MIKYHELKRVNGKITVFRGCLKNYTNALQDYHIIIKKDNKYLKAYLKRLQIYYLQKNYDSLLTECLAILNLDPHNREASYIHNVLTAEGDKISEFIEKRESWERSTSYVEKTTFPFRCSNCSKYSSKTSTCEDMEKSHVFSLTSDGSRCHRYIKM